MRSTLACSVIALSLFTAPAMADERPFNWSGFYIGAHAGYGQGEAATTQDIKDWCGPADTACIAKFVGPFPYDLKGAFGGATLGFNAQMGAVVVGVEVDAGWMGVKGSRTSESSDPAHHQRHSVDGGAYVLPSVRLGLALGPTLLYGKLGYVLIDGEQTVRTTRTGYTNVPSDSLEGLAYGGGIEFALNNSWSIKGEYLRLNIDDLRAAQVRDSDGYSFGNSTKMDPIDTLKLGVNFKF